MCSLSADAELSVLVVDGTQLVSEVSGLHMHCSSRAIEQILNRD